MKNIRVVRGNYTPVEELEVEIVERKGLGHPDTLIDGIMESISIELSKLYLNEFGRILHHNVDKGQIVGGRANPRFGGGEILDPIYILLSGRATYEVEGIEFPVQEIALKTARNYLKKAVRNLDVEGVVIESKIRPGSKDLVELFLRGKKPLANDTSFGVGYAPLSTLEKVVLEVEKFLNSSFYKQKNPFVGEDIKVMGLREGEKIKLTIAMAFVDKFVESLEEYFEFKNKVKKDIEKRVSSLTEKEVEVYLNSADEGESVYLTVSGTSAEAGDDGEVGRGNRANGLITPLRLMTLEAAAGKNPVNHVGKLYSVLAFKIAQEITTELEGKEIKDVSVSLLSQIGKPIDEPKMAFIELVGEDTEKYKDKAYYIVERNLENIEELTKEILERKHPIYY